MRTEVVIVGAGPTGLALAIQLIRYGIDFVIIDKKESTTPYSKAIGVQARTLEIYEQIGLADKLIAHGNIAGKVSFVEGGEVRGGVELSRIGEGLSPYPFLLLVEQGRHETILYDFIKSRGRDVLWKTELESFSENDDGVVVNVRTAAGEALTIEAKFLVGCDGAKSIVRHSLGLTFEGSTLERLFYVADTRIDWNFAHDSLYICLARNTITAFFPMVGENHFRIVGTFPEGHDADEGEIVYEEIEKQIKLDTELELDIHDVNWFSVYRVHSRRVNRFSVGRCFVAGDAAHIHTPAGAQGMNTGIQDGYNLAWKLAAVLQGNASYELLETYDAERGANAKRLLETTDRAFELGSSDDWLTAFVRTRIFPYVANLALSFDSFKRLIFPLVSQIGINYRESALSQTDGDFHTKAGDRMPFFMVDGESIYARLTEPKFHLLTFSDGGIAAELVGPSELFDISEVQLTPQIAEIFGCSQTFRVLLRPDNYIGLISANLNEAKLADYFAGLGGAQPL